MIQKLDNIFSLSVRLYIHRRRGNIITSPPSEMSIYHVKMSAGHL